MSQFGSEVKPKSSTVSAAQTRLEGLTILLR